MPETYETLLLERRGRVAIVTINRPDKRNALNIKTREEGAALLEQLRRPGAAARATASATSVLVEAVSSMWPCSPDGSPSRSPGGRRTPQTVPAWRYYLSIVLPLLGTLSLAS